jgi:hypothetical protein
VNLSKGMLFFQGTFGSINFSKLFICIKWILMPMQIVEQDNFVPVETVDPHVDICRMVWKGQVVRQYQNSYTIPRNLLCPWKVSCSSHHPHKEGRLIMVNRPKKELLYDHMVRWQLYPY